MSDTAAVVPASSLVLCDLMLSPSDPALVLPPICASCGAPANGLLPFANVFDRPIFKYAHAGRPNDDTAYHIVHARMPCCDACQRQHEAELPRRSSLFYVGTLFTSESMIFVVCAAIFAGYFYGRAFHGGGRGVDIGPLVIAAAATLMAVAGVFSAKSVTKRLRLAPQTSITRRFAFSDNLSLAPLTAPHFQYTLYNKMFGDAFAAANRAALWSEDNPEVRRGRRHSLTASLLIFGPILAIGAWVTIEKLWASLSQWVAH
jgi:hypothetical protein